MADIPESIRNLAEHVPAEDIALDILRAAIDDVEISTLIALDQTFPLILVRRLPTFLDFGADERFTTSMDLSIHVFTEDPDGDQVAAIISEGVRVVLRNAFLNHYYNPAYGSVNGFEVLSPPRRVPDWATASGPVQYADLPSNVWRYEGRYRLAVRKPPSLPYALP